MSRLTAEQIDTLKALHAKADPRFQLDHRYDGELIKAMRAFLPALLAAAQEAERLREEVERLRASNDIEKAAVLVEASTDLLMSGTAARLARRIRSLALSGKPASVGDGM